MGLYFLHTLNSLTLLIWSSFTVFVVLGLLAQFYKVSGTFVKAKNVKLVITSVASYSVRSSLIECILSTRYAFPDYPLTVLLDEDSELLAEVQAFADFNNISLVVVPANYRHDLLAKGRAINYFIENYVNDDFWYSFIDDDNLILDDKFLYEIPYYEKRGYMVCNPILKPRPGKSKASYVMDWIRYFDDITVFRFFTGVMATPLLGLHGELLTAKGSVLRDIGFAHHSYTEDFRFASEVVRRQYKTWQSRTVLSIKSPNSVRDLLRQRGRWFKGIIKDLPQAPLEIQIIVGWRVALWTLGIFGSWIFTSLWLLPYHVLFLFLISGVYYWMIYIYAAKQGGFRYLWLIPAFGILECISFAFGLGSKRFVVIDKN